MNSIHIHITCTTLNMLNVDVFAISNLGGVKGSATSHYEHFLLLTEPQIQFVLFHVALISMFKSKFGINIYDDWNSL